MERVTSNGVWVSTPTKSAALPRHPRLTSRVKVSNSARYWVRNALGSAITCGICCDRAIITVTEQFEPGVEVEVVEGPLRGVKTVITRVMPAKERVNILLEMLGNEREVELAIDAIRHADRNVRAETTDQFVL